MKCIIHNCAVDLFLLYDGFLVLVGAYLTFFEKSWVVIIRDILWSALPWREQRFVLYLALIYHSKKDN